MARKRRMFDIEMPLDDEAKQEEATTFPAGKVESEAAEEAPRTQRRGPMASAISETAATARERQEIEARIRAENDELAHEHVRLRNLGLLVDLIPLDQIRTVKLVRDRDLRADPGLLELKESIASIGLSNPIRVERAGEGRYELVQGYRRLCAYRELLKETGDEGRWGEIPAAVWESGESLDGLYRKMVDENLVRRDISFAEMAQLAIDYAADPETMESDPEAAVSELFKSAGYQKRSYIRSFIRLVSALGPVLLYKPKIPRALGTALVQRLDQVEGLEREIKAELEGWDNRTAREELDTLRRYLGTGSDESDESDGSDESDESSKDASTRKRVAPKSGGAKAKTSFQFDRAEGRARCTAAAGRLEVRLDRDFSTIDRRKLEAAVKAMLDQIA